MVVASWVATHVSFHVIALSRAVVAVAMALAVADGPDIGVALGCVFGPAPVSGIVSGIVTGAFPVELDMYEGQSTFVTWNDRGCASLASGFWFVGCLLVGVAAAFVGGRRRQRR